MSTRKEMKKRAKVSLKKHYIIFMIVCLIGAFLGVESGLTLDALDSQEEMSQEATGINTIDVQNAGAGDVLTDLIGDNTTGQVLEDIVEGDTTKADEISEEAETADVSGTALGDNSKILGRSRGILAMAINAVTSGAIYVKAAAALNSVISSPTIVDGILVVLSFMLTVGIWIFLENMFVVIIRRIFLEGRVYNHVTFQRLLYLLRLKKWMKVSWAMLVRFFFQMLWVFTIVGGVIKYYSYFLVPYILAENPDMGALEAINLSRKMMKGHKWECFKFQLSFLLWDILGTVTLGFGAVLYVNPYKDATYSEYYVELRKLAKENNIPGAERLDDVYLFEKAQPQLLAKTYKDVIEVLVSSHPTPQKRTGIKAFFANYLGIVSLSSKKDRDYEAWEATQLRVAMLKESMQGMIYPSRLSPIPEHAKRQRIETVNYLRHYTIWSLILMFFTFSFVGWVWEVSLHLISDGRFVNRGVLHGPWLPIYGAGGVLILTILYRFRKNAIKEFVGILILCGTVEYFTSWYLEMAHNGKKWWDYSGYFLNLNGRICAEGLMVFGMGGIAIVYAAAPLLDNYFSKIKYKVIIPICVVLGCIFMTDQIYSSKHPNTGHGITDYQTENIQEDPIRTQQMRG